MLLREEFLKEELSRRLIEDRAPSKRIDYDSNYEIFEY